MPKNTVSDPITDQEMAFAPDPVRNHAPQKLSVSIPTPPPIPNPSPRVLAYMIEHRAAVKERLVDQEAEGLRQLNLGRDQILARLWELANLSHEATRGIIAGQIRALAMIVAIEGLIPSRTMNDRRFSPSATQPAAPPVTAEIYSSGGRREQQHQPVGEEPRDPVAATKTRPAAPQVPKPEPTPEPAPKLANDTSSPNLDRNHPSVANPFINPERLNRVPAATDCVFDAVLDRGNSLRLSFSPDKRFSARLRRSL